MVDREPQELEVITSDDAMEDEPSEQRSFPIVGLGASAGGLEAFGQFLAHLPDDTGMAFVLVQHLDPKHESQLSDLLAKCTRMPVRDAIDGQEVQPNQVYVIPSDTTLSIAKGILRLESRGASRAPHRPIDFFFKSLADDRQTGAIGVILSGNGTDGTVGLEEIKAAGGITFAQDERSARHSGMPHSAISSGCVDLVLSAAEIAQGLSRIGRHPYVMPTQTTAAVPDALVEKEHFSKILNLLQVAFHVDFSAYRHTTIKRRIARRMLLNATDGWADYTKHLEGNRAELDALYQDILINVTSFFRDPQTFEALKTTVFPQIVEGKSPKTPIRIWVVGCSTGQEAYSILIALLEFLDDRPVRPGIQIFATDLSDAVSLQQAREGLYPESIEAEVSPERLRRFFLKDEGKYRIHKSLRDMIVFAKQNVAADPPYSRVDLVSCRNVLIYLSAQLQKRVLPTFHYALTPNGFLLLGHSETVGAHTDLFGSVDPRQHIYIKNPSTGRQYPHFNVTEYLVGANRGRVPTAPAASPVDWRQAADRVVLAQYAPPGVLVNESLDILQYRGQTGPYLTHASGEPSHNLVKMARDGLFLAMRAAVIECQKQDAAVHKPGVRVRSDKGDREISLHVLPIKVPLVVGRCYLILFEENAQPAAPLPQAPPCEPTSDAVSGELNQLHQELASTRDYLQSVIEQQEAATEELKSANEEVLSSNEELQSTNEELETAKEELQSINEELTTVNEQLQNRNADLGRLNDDMNNMLGSSGVPMVVFGVDLRIRRFTESAARVLDLLPTDVGRPLSSVRLPLDLPDLSACIAVVIDTVQMKELEVRGKDDRWYALRIHPYRTADHRIDGAVLVLADIHTAKTAQAELREARDLAQAIIATARDPMLVLDAALCVQTASPAFYRMFQVTPQDTEGRPLFDLGNGQWNIPRLRMLLEQLLPQNKSVEDFEVTHEFVPIGHKVMLLNARPILQGTTQTKLILLAIEDITNRKQFEETLKEADRRKNEFLAMLAHELRNPLAPISNSLQILRQTQGDKQSVLLASEMMERQVGQMVHLVEDLLDVSRISRGKIELQRGMIEIASAVNHAVDAAIPLVQKGQHELTVKLPAQPVYLYGDPTRLAQIVGNLLTNACKFTDIGGRIWLTVERQGDQVIIRVRDNGIGIPIDQLSRIFGMFTQLDTSLERSAGGLGIGLTLVKSLVELHGGTVEAHSTGEGQGSEFVVRLPLLAEQSKSPLPEPIVVQATTTPHRVLVVDDNRDAASSLAMLLDLSGNEVYVAHDGLEALKSAELFRPQLILLDIGLPTLNGHEVARRIRAQPWSQGVVLVALTGWGQEEDRRRSEEVGFNAHIIKPVDYPTLMKLLSELPAKA